MMPGVRGLQALRILAGSQGPVPVNIARHAPAQ